MPYETYSLKLLQERQAFITISYDDRFPRVPLSKLPNREINLSAMLY